MGEHSADWASAIIAFVALLFSGFSWWKSSKAADASEAAKKTSDEAKQKALDAIAKAEEIQNKTQMAMLELQHAERLSTRRDAVRSSEAAVSTFRQGRAPETFSKEEVAHLTEMQDQWRNTHEDFLNAVDGLCASYRDGKLDPERCKASYFGTVGEIARVKAPHPWFDLMHPQATSRYQAIWLVFEEWHNFEKGKKS